MKGKKTGGRDFLVGNPGGPGRPKLDRDLKNCRTRDLRSFVKAARRFMLSPVTGARTFVLDENNSALDISIARCWIKAAEGSTEHLRLLLERLIGPVPKEITGNLGLTLEELVARSQAVLNETDEDFDDEEEEENF